MELIKNRKRRALASGAATLVLLATLGATSHTAHADAFSMAQAPNANEITSSDRIGSNFVFVPRIINGKTTARAFGANATWAKASEPDIAEYSYSGFAFKTSDPGNIASKGAMGVYYSNVGSYEGKDIDMKATVLDWQNNDEEHAQYMLLGDDTLNMNIPGKGSSLKVRYDYFDHETHKPVKIQGYLSFYDFDGDQGIFVSPDTLPNVKNVYYTSDTKLTYEDVGGNGKIYQQYAPNNNTNPTDLFGATTLAYGPSDHFTYTWFGGAGDISNVPTMSNNYIAGAENSDTTVSGSVVKKDYGGFAYVAVSQKAILKSDPKIPLKRVTDSDEVLVKDNMLKNRYEQYTYEITHVVPDELEQFYYNSYVMKDTFKDILDVNKDDVKIFNSSGNDVTTQFDVVQKGQTIEAHAKTTFLKGPSFYGDEYRFVIPTKIRPGMSLKPYEDPDKLSQARIDNKSNVSVDDIDADSNDVHTRVPFRDPKAEKFVSFDGKGTTKELNVEFDKDYVYTINVTVPDKLANLDTVKIVDDLEDVQRVQKVQVIDVLTGKDVTDQGTLDSYDDKGDVAMGEATKPNITWTAKEPDKYHGKELKMLVTTKMVNIPDLQTYLDKATGRIQVPNVGKLIYNTYNLPTPPTIVTPPDVKGSVDKKIEIVE